MFAFDHEYLFTSNMYCLSAKTLTLKKNYTNLEYICQS